VILPPQTFNALQETDKSHSTCTCACSFSLLRTSVMEDSKRSLILQNKRQEGAACSWRQAVLCVCLCMCVHLCAVLCCVHVTDAVLVCTFQLVLHTGQHNWMQCRHWFGTTQHIMAGWISEHAHRKLTDSMRRLFRPTFYRTRFSGSRSG